jgi:diacylglycerol kinase family enzyme
VKTRNSTIEAALDGEPIELDSPLDFEIRLGALRVLLPARRE